MRKLEHRFFYFLFDRWVTKRLVAGSGGYDGKWLQTICLTKHYKVHIDWVVGATQEISELLK